MIRSFAIVASLLTLGLGSAVLGGCTGPHPFIREGDANSVQVTYSGDLASTLPLARRHCAEYDRVPQLVDRSLDTAYFKCNPK